MKWTVKISSFIIRSLVALGFITLAAAGALLVSYFFGAAILEGGSVIGSDSSYHLSWIHTLDRFWPRVPLWFPYAGSGSSIVFGYWIAPYYAVLKLAHSSVFNIEQAFRLLQFLTVPVVAFELYLFGWLRLKNHIIGLIAALLYPLSSIAWGWIAHAGFFSMHVSLVMVIPALIFYDAYLESALEGHLQGQSFHLLKRRLNLLWAGIFIAASLLVHLAAGASLLLALPLYTLIRSLFKLRKGEIAKRLLWGGGAFLIAVVVGIGISAFLLYPQRRYFSFQAQDFTPYYAPQDFPHLPWKGFLGFEHLKNVGALYTPLFLSKIITLMGLVGIVLGLIFRSPAGALGIMALFYVLWMSQTQFLSARFPFLNPFLLPTNLRAASLPGALFPLLAGYGVYTLVDIPGRALRFLVRKQKWLKQIIAPVTLAAAAIPALWLAGKLVYKYRIWQEYPSITDETGNVIEGYQGYGALGFLPPFCLIPGWEKLGVPETTTCEQITPPLFNCLLTSHSELVSESRTSKILNQVQDDEGETQTIFKNCLNLTKDVEINPGGRDPLLEMEIDKKLAPFALSEGTRVSISSHLGAFMQAFNSHSHASMINSPAGSSVVSLSWWGIQDQAFYQPGDVSPQEVVEMAKWFGIKYVFLHLGDDKPVLERYTAEVWPEGEVFGGAVQMREFKDSPGTAVVSNKPAVLVIGSQEKRAYESVFRAAAKGALFYDDALLIQGKNRVDDYSLEELKQFQVLILQGYSYKSRNKAWNLLRQYVEEGGGLFVDTGWQYAAEDWSTGKTDKSGKVTYFAELKEPFPVKKTTWGDAGKSWAGFNLDKEIAPELELSSFGSLTWEDKPWSLAYAEKSDLAPWAEPVLYNDDKVLVARGKLGGGKIIWSGMNLFSHAYDKDSEAEYQFIGRLLDYLLNRHSELPPASPNGSAFGGRGDSESLPSGSPGFRIGSGMTEAVEVDRPFPDQVILNIEPTSEGGSAPRSPERQSRGEEEPALRSSKSEGGWLYWAESYTPDWKAYLLTNGKKEPLITYRAGPGFQAFKMPDISQESKVILEYDLKRVLVVSFAITILTFGALMVSIFDALLLKRKIESWVQRWFRERFSFLRSLSKARLSKIRAREEEEY